MKNTTVSLTKAKARLRELAEMAAAGGSVVITKRGKPVIRLSRVAASRRPVNLEAMRRFRCADAGSQCRAGIEP